ncbi:MAG: hypothetical protein HN394_20930 [Rhodospirillaceae bacterium]|jgi:hypothetical protein|nr:hypothetical protein [Rhodospirillaceae bacterium]MBT4044460.1 hypothetical protein [Rhodospirillaceae bacterium]
MQEQHKIPATEQTAGHLVVETTHCPRHGQVANVTFETSSGLFSQRTAVAHCPLQKEGACDLACLSCIGGRAFS